MSRQESISNSSFAETVTVAIRSFREFLRKNFGQVDRMAILDRLKLRNHDIYNSEYNLYIAANNILEEINNNMEIPDQGYYAYSGLDNFRQYLQDYLNEYLVDDHNNVMHRGQRASRAILEAIQMASMPDKYSDQAIAEKLYDCNEVVAVYGNQEQVSIYQENLQKLHKINPPAYGPVLNRFTELLGENASQVA